MFSTSRLGFDRLNTIEYAILCGDFLGGYPRAPYDYETLYTYFFS